MNWIIITLIAPLFWAISNHIDKYLISKYFKDGGVGALVIFSSLIGVALLPIILLIEPNVLQIDPLLAILLILNGFLYILALLPYLYALENDDISLVAPLFQTIPVFSYFLALFVLNESLAWPQLLAASLIILGAVLISLNFNKHKRFNAKVFWLMALSSFLVAINALIFKFVAQTESFWMTSFWEYVGFSVVSVLLFVFIKSYRQQFLRVFKHNRTSVLGINSLNELINIVAKIIMNFATLLAPLALVWTLNGFQPLFVLIISIMLALFLPSLAQEKLSKQQVLQRVAAILIMFIGTILLNF